MAASADDIAYLGVITKAATALVSDSRVQATMHIMLSVGCAHHLPVPTDLMPSHT